MSTGYIQHIYETQERKGINLLVLAAYKSKMWGFQFTEKGYVEIFHKLPKVFLRVDGEAGKRMKGLERHEGLTGA